MRPSKLVDDIIVSLEFPQENKSRSCFIVFSSREEHREVVIDCIESVIEKKKHYDIKRLDEALKSGDSQYTELVTLLNSCSFAIVILDGFRPNVLFEYGILKGLKKPCIVLLEQNATIDVASLMLDSTSKKYNNPRIDMNKHFSDVKDQFYVKYDKNNPKGIRDIINKEYLKFKSEIKSEFIRMIFPNKDFVEKELRDRLTDLANLYNKSEKAISTKDYSLLNTIIKNIKAISNKHNITLPSSYYFILAQLNEIYDKNESALQIINSLISKGKTRLTYLDFKSFILRKLGRYDEALDIIDSALKLYPQIESLWHNKGLILERLKRKRLALIAYEKGIKLPHQCSAIHFHCGILLYEFRKFQKAFLQFEHALKLNKNHPDYVLWKAKCLYELRKKETAISLVKQVALTSAKNANAWFILGTWSDDEIDSRKYFRKALKADSKHSGALCSLAASLSNSGRYKEALDIFKKMKQYCSNYNSCKIVLSNTLITTYKMKKNFKESDFASLLSLAYRHNHPDILGAIAIIAWQEGKRKEGLLLFKKALLKAPKDATLWYNQACAYSLLGKSSSAIRSLKKAISLDPNRKNKMLDDSDFNKIRNTIEFRKTFDKLKSKD
jgi:pentatricopeptide repeat protein